MFPSHAQADGNGGVDPTTPNAIAYFINITVNPPIRLDELYLKYEILVQVSAFDNVNEEANDEMR